MVLSTYREPIVNPHTLQDIVTYSSWSQCHQSYEPSTTAHFILFFTLWQKRTVASLNSTSSLTMKCFYQTNAKESPASAIIIRALHSYCTSALRKKPFHVVDVKFLKIHLWSILPPYAGTEKYRGCNLNRLQISIHVQTKSATFSS